MVMLTLRDISVGDRCFVCTRNSVDYIASDLYIAVVTVVTTMAQCACDNGADGFDWAQRRKQPWPSSFLIRLTGYRMSKSRICQPNWLCSKGRRHQGTASTYDHWCAGGRTICSASQRQHDKYGNYGLIGLNRSKVALAKAGNLNTLRLSTLSFSSARKGRAGDKLLAVNWQELLPRVEKGLAVCQNLWYWPTDCQGQQ